MDLQAVFSEAVQLHSQGHLEQAKYKYYQIHQVLPDNINVLGNLGVVCRDLGQFEEALDYCLKAARLAPHDPAQLINLGAVYETGGRIEEAKKSYAGALKLAPNHPKALNNFGKILHLQGKASEALAYLEKAVAVEPNYPLALNNIGVILSERGEIRAAVSYLEKSNALDPHNLSANYNLAGLYNVLGEKEKAVEMLNRVLQREPNHSSSKHMLAAIQGRATDMAPEEYVVETFDRYAARFDIHLQEALCYNVPEVLAEMVVDSFPGIKVKHCLDLGCGTGISGAAFRPLSTSLTGVDLSSLMLEKAKEKKLYDQLHCGEVYNFLKGTGDKYDLIVAADVLIYLGRLDTFFAAVEPSAEPGAVIACSIESYQGPEGYVLRSTGRYAHSHNYLISEAESHGFSILASRGHGIRKEDREWIAGCLYILQKAV